MSSFLRVCRLLPSTAEPAPNGGVRGAIRDLPSGAQESAAMQDWWHPLEETKDVPPARSGLWDLIDSSLNKHHWYVSHGVFPPTAASWREQNAPPCCLCTLAVLTSRKNTVNIGAEPLFPATFLDTVMTLSAEYLHVWALSRINISKWKSLSYVGVACVHIHSLWSC